MSLARVTVIRSDGTEETHDVQRTILCKWVERVIDCDLFDVVNLRDGRVMLVDDLGHDRGKPRNEKATALYHSICKPGTTHFIAGDVVVALDEDFG